MEGKLEMWRYVLCAGCDADVNSRGGDGGDSSIGGSRGGSSLILGGVDGSGVGGDVGSGGTGGMTVSAGLTTESPPEDLVRLWPRLEVKFRRPRRDGEANRCSAPACMNGFDVERPKVEDPWPVEGLEGGGWTRDMGLRDGSSTTEAVLLEDEMKLSTFERPGFFVVADVCDRLDVDPRRLSSGESVGGGEREPSCATQGFGTASPKSSLNSGDFSRQEESGP